MLIYTSSCYVHLYTHVPCITLVWRKYLGQEEWRNVSNSSPLRLYIPMSLGDRGWRASPSCPKHSHRDNPGNGARSIMRHLHQSNALTLTLCTGEGGWENQRTRLLLNSRVSTLHHVMLRATAHACSPPFLSGYQPQLTLQVNLHLTPTQIPPPTLHCLYIPPLVMYTYIPMSHALPWFGGSTWVRRSGETLATPPP